MRGEFGMKVESGRNAGTHTDSDCLLVILMGGGISAPSSTRDCMGGECRRRLPGREVMSASSGSGRGSCSLVLRSVSPSLWAEA